jgi:tetratricopeptide (TPR) repeat protein
MQIQEAIRRAFGVEPQSFENAVRNYFTVDMKDHKIALPADFGKSSMEVKTLRASDWMATWADLRAHTPNERDAGIDLYKKVLLTDPNNAIANRGMGFAYLQNNEFDKAQGYLQKTVAADPGDARTHYFLALVANRKQRVLHGEPVVDLSAVREHLQKAIALKPNYADAYQLLSWVELEGKNADAARAAIEKASDMNPRSDFVALSMAQLELQANQYEKARPLLERLQGSNQPEVARFAHQALQNLGSNKPRSSIVTRQPITAPQWQTKEPEGETAEKEKPPAPKPATAATPEAAGKIQFLKGELVDIDCSKSPLVTMTVSSKGKEWVMFSRDVHKLMLIGVENFSCTWTNKKASVNYRLTADGRGELISLEID